MKRAASLPGLNRRHETRAPESCDLRGVPVHIGCGDRLNRRRAVIVAQDAGHVFMKNGLAVGARAVGGRTGVRAGISGEAVTQDALQEPDQLSVAVQHPLEERIQAGHSPPGSSAVIFVM